MLKSKFAKKAQTFQAQKLFTDRIEPRAAFAQSIYEIDKRPQELLIYYGKGGIGKTTLLKSLLAESPDTYRLRTDYTFHNIFVSLDAYEYANPVNILTSIRSGITGDCGLFDYALMQYCSKAKMTIEEIKDKNDFLSSPIMDILDEAINIGTASACMPSAILKKCVTFIKDLRFKDIYKEEIAEMDGLNEFDLFERLPYYLGICISYAAEKGHLHTLFLDSYESLLARTIRVTPSVGNEDWLKELFLSSEVIRIVIASRDRIRWDKEDADWAEYLNQHRLANLSDEDSRWFLEQVPITDSKLIENIVKHACGVPLYLDMCVDMYENAINDGNIFDGETLQSGDKIIERYIRHLIPKDKYAIRVLSVLRSFNLEYALQLLQLQNLLYTKEELLELFEKSIVIPLEDAKNRWKIDESVRLHLLENASDERKTEILEHVLDCCISHDKSNSFVYLASVLELTIQNPSYVEIYIEKLLQTIEHAAHAGYWNELHSILSPCLNGESKKLRAAAVMTEIIWLRRTGRLSDADILIRTYPVSKEDMGIWFYLYRFLRIQIRHLLGHYEECMIAYKTLLDEMHLIRSVIPIHIYNLVCMKYADLLFLNGKFSESLKIVDELLERPDTPLEDQIELLRIKGHIYRFQHQYRAGELIYRSALKLIFSHGLKAYEGKLYTNMTEVLCTEDPTEALQWFEKASVLNDSVGNDIELGKAQAAASAAYTTLGDYANGEWKGKQALQSAEKTGYKSGRAFALTVLYYVYKKSGKTELAEDTREALERQIEEIGVYRYLLDGVREG